MKSSLILFILLLFIGCSTSQKKLSTSQNQDLEFYFMQDKSLPLIEIGLLLRGGSSLDPMGQKGITALTTSIVLENEKIIDQAQNQAINLHSQVSSEAVLIYADGLSQTKENALKYFYNLIHQPVWKKSIFESKKRRALQALRAVNDNPESLADNAFRLFLFGNHPYGAPVTGLSQDVRKLKLDDCKKFYNYILQSPRPIFYVVGDFDEDFKNKVIEKFNSWKASNNIYGYWPKPPPINQKEILFFPRSDAKQTKIRIGHFTAKENDPEQTKLDLASEILGGSFISRLNQRLRIEKSYTYGVQSMTISKKAAGYLEIDTSTKPETTAAVIEDSLQVLKTFIDKGITEEELARAKQDAIMEFIKNQETASGKIWFYLEQKLYDEKMILPEDKIKQIKSVSVSDLNEIIKEKFTADKLKIVVTGPQKVLSQLSTLGLVTVKSKLDF